MTSQQVLRFFQKKKPSMYVTLAALVLLVLVLPLTIFLAKQQQQTRQYAAGGTNLLQNGSFENTGNTWLSPWSVTVRNGAAATVTQDSPVPAVCGTYAAHVSVTATSPNVWDVQLYQGNIPITQGQTITLTFFAKASAARNVNINLEQNYSPYNAYLNQDIQVGTVWRQYTVSYTPTVSDNNTMFTFNLAQSTGQVWLDNVVLQTTGTAPTATPAPTSPAATGTPTPTPIASGSMPPPPGYSKLIFDDQFQGTSLDTTKWYPQVGDSYFPWNNRGKLTYPLSGVNSGEYEAEYYDPRQLTVNNGLTITAVPDTSQSGYTWRSGVIDTHDKFKISGGYLQVRAQMPDSRTGGWGTIWGLEGGCEFDTQESGFTDLGTTLVNQEMTSHMPGCNGNGQFYNAGVDLSAGYHIYGMRYIPGQSVTTYLDGHQVAQWTTNIPTGGETVILSLGIGSPNASGFHTVASSQTPVPLIMKISEVQVWQ